MRLGFGSSPQGRMIYLNRQYTDCLWYFWDKTLAAHQPIGHASLTGIVTSVKVRTAEYRGKPDSKLQVHLDCGDDRFILELGLDTITGRDIIQGLSLCDLSKPVAFEPKAGDEEKVLFVGLYDSAGKVRVEKDKPVDLPQLLDDLIEKTGGEKAPTKAIEASTSSPIQAVKVSEWDKLKRLNAKTEKDVLWNRGILSAWIAENYKSSGPVGIPLEEQAKALRLAEAHLKSKQQMANASAENF